MVDTSIGEYLGVKREPDNQCDKFAVTKVMKMLDQGGRFGIEITCWYKIYEQCSFIERLQESLH